MKPYLSERYKKDEILLQPLWGLCHSLVCCIFPAYMESSSVCTSWWRASHLQCRQHNRKSRLHPPARNRSLSSMLAAHRLTYKPKDLPRFEMSGENETSMFLIFTCLLWGQDPPRRTVHPPFLHSTFPCRFYKLQSLMETDTAVIVAFKNKYFCNKFYQQLCNRLYKGI